VLQHFAKGDVETTLREVRRVLRPGGRTTVQMPNRFGARALYHQARRGFREGRGFEVRYWTPGELRRTFGGAVGGPASLAVDGFFTINPQPAEAHVLPLRYRLVVRTSELLRRASALLPPLAYVADSLYVNVRKEQGV
jgi:hypothetical protein